MSHRIEIIVPAGLEALARAEAQRIAGIRLDPPGESGVISATMRGPLPALFDVRCATSVFLVRSFAIPRPRALLGDEHFRAVTAMIDTVRRLHPTNTFQTLFLSAAGTEQCAAALQTRAQRAAGPCSWRRRWRSGAALAPQPRSGRLGCAGALDATPVGDRPWRVCNREGALNGPVAHAMALLSKPRASDRVLNVACGSGTLLIERLLIGPAAQAIGCDTDPEALACAYRNLAAAGLSHKVALHDWDAQQLPLPPASVDVVLADLPFGHLVGSHASNVTLYPALLREAARVTRLNGCAVIISHEVRLMERTLAELPEWRLEQHLRVDLGGLYPRIFVLRRVAHV